mgnify:CR=1 FL=1
MQKVKGPLMPKLNHVALTLKDRDVSAAFYDRYFGFSKRVHEDDHLLILAGGDGGLLALSSGEVPKDLPRTNHFGLQAASADEVLEMRARFAADGVEATKVIDNPGIGLLLQAIAVIIGTVRVEVVRYTIVVTIRPRISCRVTVTIQIRIFVGRWYAVAIIVAIHVIRDAIEVTINTWNTRRTLNIVWDTVTVAIAR